jgi:hypothetical protein
VSHFCKFFKLDQIYLLKRNYFLFREISRVEIDDVKIIKEVMKEIFQIKFPLQIAKSHHLDDVL